MAVSFKNDIKPLFRSIDVEHMKQYGVVLDDYAYMSDGAGDHANARAVLNTLTKGRCRPMDRSGPKTGSICSRNGCPMVIRSEHV